MGKGRRKSNTNKLRSTPSGAPKSSEIAPKFKKTQKMNFKTLLLEKILIKQKKFLKNANNLEEWRRLNLEGSHYYFYG